MAIGGESSHQAKAGHGRGYINDLPFLVSDVDRWLEAVAWAFCVSPTDAGVPNRCVPMSRFVVC